MVLMTMTTIDAVMVVMVLVVVMMYVVAVMQEVAAEGEGANQIGMDMYTFCQALGPEEVCTDLAIMYVVFHSNELFCWYRQSSLVTPNYCCTAVLPSGTGRDDALVVNGT